jgi:hypothetical protein
VRTVLNNPPTGNRWQVLDQTGEDMDLSIEEVRRERREEIREETLDRERNREQDDMVGELRRVSQPGTSVRVERTTEGGSQATGDDNRAQSGTDKDGDRGMAARKRNLQERSPGQHEDTRANRPRLDEFDIGKVFEELDRKLRIGMGELVDNAPEDYKDTLRKGLDVMLEGMKSVMNGTSDCVAEERKCREAEGIRIEDRMEKLDEKIDDLKRMSENFAEEKLKEHIRASEREMEERVRHAGSCLKLLDLDFGKITDDRLWMVRSVIRWLKDDIHPQNVDRYERIMRRTRVQILGRSTVAVSGKGGGGGTIYTVPVLLECQGKSDAVDLDQILKDAGYFSTFHWPVEMLEFVKEARQEMRKVGYEERTHYIRIRPEVKGGEVQIRADVKEKNGGRWHVKAFWQCPPADRELWRFITDISLPRLVGRRD